MPDTPRADRRAFLRRAGTLTVAAVAAPALDSCDRAAPDTTSGAAGGSGAPELRASPRAPLGAAALAALGDAVLPGSLGADGRRQAVAAFADWVNGYAPVAEEMHGYGYPEVRYLPADPAPGWQAQLVGLDLLARRTHGRPFATLAPNERRQVVEAALRDVGGDRLPSPLGAPHVAMALLAHWAASPAAWNLAYGARITPNSCRPLGDAPRRPLPIAAISPPTG